MVSEHKKVDVAPPFFFANQYNIAQVKRLWSNELRGMQGKQQPPPSSAGGAQRPGASGTQKPGASAQKKGRKIPVVQASDSEESEEENETRQTNVDSKPVRVEQKARETQPTKHTMVGYGERFD